MIDIKNFEEKKRIITLYKCLYNKYPKNLLTNSSIYAAWIENWIEDFNVNGKKLKMWHQKFIESVSKHKMNNEDPHYVEYNNLINSVTEFANSNYNIKAKKVDNVQNCISILKEYREKCLKELNSILKKKSKDNLYIIQSKFKMKNWLDLAKYTVKTDKEILFEGNFEDTKDYLLKEAY